MSQNLLSPVMGEMVSKGSSIRRMFDAGIEMKKQFGEDAVCDFSLGNPDLAPPPQVATMLRELADKASAPASLGYMPNAGFDWALQALAEYLSAEQTVALSKGDVMLSCGAAGALNAFLHSVLSPGDEVLGIAPYFVEYGYYSSNHGGTFKPTLCRPEDFGPDLAAIEAAISPKTRAFIINSPNNPSGAVYSKQDIEGIVALLRAASQKYNRPIYLISDEPYRFLTYDGAIVPPVLPLYEYAVVVGSFSKNYCLAGERIGYVALSPALEGREKLMAGMVMSNRVLGYVNPPIVGQYLMKASLGASTAQAVEVYTRRRDALAEILKSAGYSYTLPKGAFYFFPKAPNGKDADLVEHLKEQRVLVTPGAGFGYPGHFRISFAVDDKIIARSRDGFVKAIAQTMFAC